MTMVVEMWIPLHGFLDAIDPLCSCSAVIENTVHYFIYSPNFSSAGNIFLNEIVCIDRSVVDREENIIVQTFLDGNPTCSFNNNKLIFDVKHILETKRFEGLGF